MKKTWITPQLIELVRGAPEEAVLTACKTTGNVGGPQATDIGCQENQGFCLICFIAASS